MEGWYFSDGSFCRSPTLYLNGCVPWFSYLSDILFLLCSRLSRQSRFLCSNIRHYYSASDQLCLSQKRMQTTSFPGTQSVAWSFLESSSSNVPLDYTIKVILRKIYTNKLIKTKLKRDEMKDLLEICTKELHLEVIQYM